MWKAGTALAGLLLYLLLMLWVPVSSVGASERTSEATTPTTGTVQATPTEDATLTALNKEKLQEDIEKDRSDLFWAWTSSGVIVVGIAGIIFSLFQFYRTQLDKRVEREGKEEEEFHSLIRDLGDEKTVTKIDAAITLRKFLRPGYEQYYRQIFDWMVINLRQPFGLDHAFRQELITTFKASFPIARTSLTRARARIVRFNPSLLDASRVFLDDANLSQSDLGKIDMPNASFGYANLSGANLSLSYLHEANFSRAVLTYADLSDADLSGANLSEADLSDADLSRAHLIGANLQEARSLENTNLRGVIGLTKYQLKACKAKGAIIDEDTPAVPPQSTASPTTPAQSTNAQPPSPPPAQVNTPPPSADGSSGSSAQPKAEP